MHHNPNPNPNPHARPAYKNRIESIYKLPAIQSHSSEIILRWFKRTVRNHLGSLGSSTNGQGHGPQFNTYRYNTKHLKSREPKPRRRPAHETASFGSGLCAVVGWVSYASIGVAVCEPLCNSEINLGELELTADKMPVVLRGKMNEWLLQFEVIRRGQASALLDNGLCEHLLTLFPWLEAGAGKEPAS